jgi:non-homologous end joining protein Ku
VARPFWTGQIRISLVSFGVKLFPAVEAKGEIRFHRIARSTGERVRHRNVFESDTGPVAEKRSRHGIKLVGSGSGSAHARRKSA